jgi:ABC-type lipoprotein export system ATPase subunit
MPLPLFIIQNLSCSYKRGNKVLRIPYLEIPRGKLVVLLGESGSGKSTFLETLGLMNNTIHEGDVVFHPYENQEPVSYSKLWQLGKYEEIARIRREYFSFIFQSTNLMPNFTAVENACLSQLIKGVPRNQAYENVKKIMRELRLDDIPEWKKSVEISGGQKQRLAFVRAITPEFLVLFGDEPTGNLDNLNSEELISILNQNIHRNARSGIIVSHNIELSLLFADIIIIIQKAETEHPYYTISQEHVFEKDGEKGYWMDYNHTIIPDMNKTIIHFMYDHKHVNLERT